MSDTSLSGPLSGPLSGIASGAASSAMGGAAPSAASGTDKAQLHQVAQQFEAIFVRQMLAEARKSNMGDTLFSNQGTDTFREMQEQTFAQIVTKQGGLGFARMIEKSLSLQLARTNGTGTDASTTGKKG